MAGSKKYLKNLTIRRVKNSSPNESIKILENAWEGLPDDFSQGERSLFVEVAERLIKIAIKSDDHLN